MNHFWKIIGNLLITGGLLLIYSLPTYLISTGQEIGGMIAAGIVIFILLSYYLFKTQEKRQRLVFTWQNIKNVIIGYGIILLCNYILSLTIQTDTTVNNQEIVTLSHNISPFTLFTMLCLLAPIGEEIIFRFCLINSFGDVTDPNMNLGKFVGLIVSSSVFGLMHQPENIIVFLVYTTLGGVMGLIYLKSQRLEVSMFLHFINNFIPFLVLIM